MISVMDEHFAVDKEGGIDKTSAAAATETGMMKGLESMTLDDDAAGGGGEGGVEVVDDDEGYADMASYEDTTLVAADEVGR